MIHALRFDHAFHVVVNVKFYRCAMSKALRYQAVFSKELATGTKNGPVKRNGADAFVTKM